MWSVSLGARVFAKRYFSNYLIGVLLGQTYVEVMGGGCQPLCLSLCLSVCLSACLPAYLLSVNSYLHSLRNQTFQISISMQHYWVLSQIVLNPSTPSRKI